MPDPTVRPAPRPERFTRAVQHAVDLGVLAASFPIAYALRFDFHIPRPEIGHLLLQLPYVVVLQLVAIRATGLQSFIWRYIGISEVTAFVTASFWSALPVVVLRLALPEFLGALRVPISVTLVDTMIAFGSLVAARVLRRSFHERREHQRPAFRSPRQPRKAVLLIGAGRAGVAAAREIRARRDLGLEIRGFLDDDRQKHGLLIQGVRVIGGTDALPRLVAELGIDHVLISMAQASRQQLKRIMRLCDEVHVKVRIIPALTEILEGRLNFSRIRDVQVEDLLGREPVNLDDEEIGHLLGGRAIMVTGAGGSIGSELARQVGRFRPSVLLLVERAEAALFTSERQLREVYPHLAIRPLLADVADRERITAILTTWRPDVILHAAAHKHVPMMEWNPTEAVKNNVIATYRLAEMAAEFHVGVFVLISTDKAVRPRSVMGASKRMAELAVQTLADRTRTRFVTVRFGNVIGSTGSVLPIFREQIRKGGPLTVTHPDVTRYFMTIPEAAQLVLQAATLGAGGEIFILDMGEPVRIVDLAKDTIRLSGLRPFEDIEIAFTGLRPGEKLTEELTGAGERMSRTRHTKIFVADSMGVPRDDVLGALADLETLAADGDEMAIRRRLNAIVPDAQLELATGPLVSHEGASVAS